MSFFGFWVFHGVGGWGVRIEVNIATRLRNLGSLLGFLT